MNINLIISRMKKYKEVGYMNVFEIDQIIKDLEVVYNQEKKVFSDKLVEEISNYYVAINNENLNFEEYVREHLNKCANILGCSQRTIYRRLRDSAFSMNEKRLILKEMNKDEHC